MAPTVDLATLLSGDVSSPLLYLPSHLAHQISAVTYIHIGMTTVLIWDCLDNLRNDFKLLFFFKFGIPSFAHFASRISLLVYSIGRAVLLTAPVGNCTTLARTIHIFPILFAAFTSLLLYIRVFAMYNRDRVIGIFFGIPWLAAIGMASTFSLIMSAENIGPTKYCIETIADPHHFLIVTYTLLLTSEILVYLAVVWKIYLMFLEHTGTSFGQKFKALVHGTSLPILSKIILLDSQMYFLFAVLSKVFLLLTIIFLKPPLQTMFVTCHLVLVNIIASRIYRNLKMGLDDEKAVQSLVINLTNPSTSPPTQNVLQQSLTFRTSPHTSNSISVEDGSVDSDSQEKVFGAEIVRS